MIFGNVHLLAAIIAGIQWVIVFMVAAGYQANKVDVAKKIIALIASKKRLPPLELVSIEEEK